MSRIWSAPLISFKPINRKGPAGPPDGCGSLGLHAGVPTLHQALESKVLFHWIRLQEPSKYPRFGFPFVTPDMEISPLRKTQNGASFQECVVDAVSLQEDARIHAASSSFGDAAGATVMRSRHVYSPVVASLYTLALLHQVPSPVQPGVGPHPGRLPGAGTTNDSWPRLTLAGNM